MEMAHVMFFSGSACNSSKEKTIRTEYCFVKKNSAVNREIMDLYPMEDKIRLAALQPPVVIEEVAG